MSVPNTTTFTLLDVCVEIGLTGSNRNLSQCFTSAVSAQFDPAYSGSKDNLLNFRNYGAVTMTAFNTSIQGTTELLSCGEARLTTRYHNGANPDPTSGDIVYTDSAGTTVFNGGGQWFKISNHQAGEISASGVIGLGILC